MDKKLIERGQPYDQKNWERIRVLVYVSNILSRFPRFKNIVKYFWGYTLITRYQRQLKRYSIDQENEFDINKIYWVDPKKIQFISLIEFNTSKDKGKIIDGDWDLLEKKFEDLDVYIAFKERFIDRKKWETTVFYQRMLNEINQGKFLWGCKNQSDFDNRLKKLELLFKTIKKNGYKSQQELHSKNLDPLKLDDEVAVNIGRYGDLLFNNGAHRLSIAKILNIPKIPIKITVRHPQSIKLKKLEFVTEK